MRKDRPSPVRPTGCLQASIEDRAGLLLVPMLFTDPETGAPVPVDERCGECGELYGQHRHLACCVAICGRCGEALPRCVCPAA